MPQLFQSPFLQSLGYAIANSLWQTALVWLLYNTLALIPSLSAALRYRIAVAAQLTGLGWFLCTFRFYYRQYASTSLLPSHIDQQVSGPVFAGPASQYNGIIGWMLRGEQLLPYISMAYLLLILVLCIRWILGYQKTLAIKSTGLEKIPVDWRLFVQRTAAQLGIRQKVEVFLSAGVPSPLTIGFWKPVILVPVASINHLSTDQLEAVLLHELAHIRRGDYLVNLLLSVVEISLFFNPFTQLLSKSIQKERENSCDDWVLQFQYQAADYAKALLCIATLQQMPALAMAANGRRNELLVRVKRMIGQQDTSRFSYRRQLMALLLMTGMISSIAWFVPHTVQKHAQAAAAIQQRPRLQQKKIQAAAPMAVTVDNPLFNPVFFLSKPLKEAINKNISEAKKEMEQALMANDPVTENSLAAAVPALVTSAMEKAAAQPDKEAIEPGTVVFPNEAAITFSKMNAWHLDSIWQKKIRVDLHDEIRKLDMRKINEDIRRAGIEMEKAMKEITRTAFRQQQVKQELASAMKELDRLKKNAPNISHLPSPAFVDEQETDQILQRPFLPEPDIELPVTSEIHASAASRKTTYPDPEEAVAANTVHPVKRISPQLLLLLDSLSQDNRLHPLVLAKIKTILRQQLVLHKLRLTQMIPAVLIRSLPDSSGPQQFLIHFQ